MVESLRLGLGTQWGPGPKPKRTTRRHQSNFPLTTPNYRLKFALYRLRRACENNRKPSVPSVILTEAKKSAEDRSQSRSFSGPSRDCCSIKHGWLHPNRWGISQEFVPDMTLFSIGWSIIRVRLHSGLLCMHPPPSLLAVRARPAVGNGHMPAMHAQTGTIRAHIRIYTTIVSKYGSYDSL